MNITFKCRCGRVTTYGPKCVSCAGLTLEFIKRNEHRENDDDKAEDDDPKPLDRPTVRKKK